MTKFLKRAGGVATGLGLAAVAASFIQEPGLAWFLVGLGGAIAAVTGVFFLVVARDRQKNGW